MACSSSQGHREGGGDAEGEDSGATCFSGFDCLLFLLSLFVFEIFVVFLINILTCIFIFYFYCLFLNFSWWGMLQG